MDQSERGGLLSGPGQLVAQEPVNTGSVAVAPVFAAAATSSAVSA